MQKTLGIMVATKDHMAHVLGIAHAARKAGIHTDIFFTGDGVRLTQDIQFSKLINTANRVGICEVSFRHFGYKKELLSGLTDKDFATQARNANMIQNCDRYIVL